MLQAESHHTYKCPADKYLSPDQVKAGMKARTRSMAMNSFVGPYGYKGAGKNYYSGAKNNYTTYRQWLKMTQIRRPANFFVTIDERPDTLNDGLFNNDPDWASATRWSDAPASYHCGRAGISYADGHSEVHNWRSDTTRLPVLYVDMPARAASMTRFDGWGREDFRWMTQRQAVPLPNF